ISCNNTSAVGYNYVPNYVAGTCTDDGTAHENGPVGDVNAKGCNYQCPVWPATIKKICDGKDNDCNGLTDEANNPGPVPPATNCPNGLTPPGTLTCANKGACNGVSIPISCYGASGWACDYTVVPNAEYNQVSAGPVPPATPPTLRVTEKRCDNIDGNCNNSVDLDGFLGKGSLCSAGIGVCAGTGSVV